MGLGTSSNKTYLSIVDGKIVQRVTADTPGAQSRAKKDGAIVYELKFSYLTATLVGIQTKNSSYAGQDFKEWILDLSDGKDNFQLQIMYDSRYATSLLFALCNPAVDLTKPITITPWMKVVNDKKKTSCYLAQFGESIEWYFTKDNPNGMPDLEKVVFKGKENWDSFNRMQFLEKFVEMNIKPKLTGIPSGHSEPNNQLESNGDEPVWTAQPANQKVDISAPAEGEDDDLPF